MKHGLNLGYVILLALALVQAACTVTDSAEDARRIASQYYAAIKAGDFEKAVSFYRNDARDRWREFLRGIHDRSGDLKDYAFKGVEVNTVFSGKFYLFKVDTTYARSTDSEILTIFRKLSDKQIHVVSQKVSSESF